jgi:uridine kinase
MPMEVCLSRVIQRHLKHSNDPATTITNYLRKYDGHLRDVYMAAANQVRQSSDLIITNVDTIASIQSIISDWLHNNVK